MWDLQPWDNDAAAVWYGDLMDNNEIREHWLEGIEEDASENPQIVRAAAGLFLMLGRIHIWPMNHFYEDLELTVTQLKLVRDSEDYQEMDELLEVIESELIELESRIDS